MDKRKKEFYDNPLAEFLLFSDEDIITTSGEGGGDEEEKPGGNDWTGEWDTDF